MKAKVARFADSAGTIKRAAAASGVVVVQHDGREDHMGDAVLVSLFVEARKRMRGNHIAQAHIAKLAESVASEIRCGQPVSVSLRLVHLLGYYMRGAKRLDV